MQEKILIKNEKNKKKEKNISKFLSNKIGKDEKKLIFNGNNKYLIKRQILKYLYNNQLLSEKFGNFY